MKNQNLTQRSAQFSFPIFISYYNRDNILNPKKSKTFHLETKPTINTINKKSSHIKNCFNGTFYQFFNITKKPTLAYRIATGFIIDTNIKSIPITEKFFTGGKSSIQGYSYQSVGLINQKNKPQVGRSFIKFSTEPHMDINKKYELTTFPNFNKSLNLRSGIGLHYYINFGFLRLDIAFPLSKNANLNTKYRLYLSIGQTF